MYIRVLLSGFAALCLAMGPRSAKATSYTVDCGTNGSSDVVQSQVDAVESSPDNTISVTGTCQGDLFVRAADRLTVSGLTLNGNILVIFGSRVTFQGLTLSLPADYLGFEAGINCGTMSTCNLMNSNLSDTSGGVAGALRIGVIAQSGSSVVVQATTISGFDYGVMADRNGMAFVGPGCGNIAIQSSRTAGVYVKEAAFANVEGYVSDSCTGQVTISSTAGLYGVLAEGGGKASLYRTTISGHLIDSIRVQDGSVVKVRSSTVGAASTSGRSARVKSQSLLWFNEEDSGPTAGSTFAGPVCVSGNSSIDTDNSSTAVVTTGTCTS